MTKLADLEITLRRLEPGAYAVDLKSSPAGMDNDDRHTAAIKLNAEALKTQPTADAYGRALGEALFADPVLLEAFNRARTLAQAAGAALRFRLLIDDSAAELHAVRWETLRGPAGEELLNGHDCWFSRYLSSQSWKPVLTTPARPLKALVVIANPKELEQQPAGLAPIPVAANKAWAEKSLGGISVTFLTSGDDARPSLANLSGHLRDGCDILFLIAHGSLKQGEPRLWLENDEGAADIVTGPGFVDALKRLPAQPRLVVLASCQSAGTGASEDALTALGPLLATAGVPAVIAMQGKVAMETIDEFMPVFFAELRRDGQIDRAMATARGAALAAKRADYWMPVLFMRLRSGSLWYRPGFAESSSGATEFERWATIKGAIEDRQCTPILGPGMAEHLLGSPRDLARALATKYKYPLSPAALDDLPTVAQYLSINQGNTIFPRRELRKSLAAGLMERFGAQLKDFDPADLPLILTEAGKLERARTTTDPHRILAAKPFPTYLTVNPDSLMEDALAEAGRPAQSDFARWNEKIADVRKYPTLRDRLPDYRPSVKEPLVYHLYGQLSIPESLVVTEDDYFDYLLRIGSKADGKNLTPGPVGTALTAHALLFVGFRLDDWAFRVLLRSIYSKEGSGARAIGNDTLPCVGAQITPDEDNLLKPDAARRYFEQYLRSTNIDIYWGGVDEFLAALNQQTA